MAQDNTQKKARFYELDLLRFIAASMVVLYHYTFQSATVGINPLAYPEVNSITRYGYLGVEVFFIISGYVVLMSAEGKTVRQFFSSRVTRLYPAYWVATILTFITCYLFAALPAGFQDVGAMKFTVPQLAFNLTMLQEFFGLRNINGSYWTLTIELIFYFLISLLIGYKLLPRLLPILAGWLLLIMLAYTSWPVIATPFNFLLFPKYAPYFICGMLFYLIQERRAAKWKLYSALAVASALALYSCIRDSQDLAEVYHAHFSPLVAGSVVGVVLLLFLLKANGLLRLKNPALAQLGALTYPLYLLHENIGYAMFQHSTALNKWAVVGGVFASMLVFAWVLHKVEAPISKQVKLLLQKL